MAQQFNLKLNPSEGNEIQQTFKFWNIEFSSKFSDFLQAIVSQADCCNFLERERMIRDKIVLSTKGILQSQLLGERKLHLQKCIDICLLFESQAISETQVIKIGTKKRAYHKENYAKKVRYAGVTPSKNPIPERIKKTGKKRDHILLKKAANNQDKRDNAKIVANNVGKTKALLSSTLSSSNSEDVQKENVSETLNTYQDTPLCNRTENHQLQNKSETSQNEKNADKKKLNLIIKMKPEAIYNKESGVQMSKHTSISKEGLGTTVKIVQVAGNKDSKPALIKLALRPPDQHHEKEVEPNLFSCKACGDEFDDRNKFRDHCLEHSFARKKFFFETKLQNHMSTHASDFEVMPMAQCTDSEMEPKSKIIPSVIKTINNKESDVQMMKHQSTSKEDLGTRVTIVKVAGDQASKDASIKVATLPPDQHHEEGEPRFYYCKACCEKFDDDDKFYDHCIEHSVESKFNCSICNKKFISETKLEKHMCTHRTDFSDLSMAECTYTEIMPQSIIIDSVILSQGQCIDYEVMPQDVCIANNDEKEKSFVRIVMKAKGILNSNDPELKDFTLVQCKDCNKRFLNIEDYNAHINSGCKITEKSLHNYICMACGLNFAKVKELDQHVHSAHGGTGVECHICKKAFPKHVNLRAHIMTHSDNRNFLCDLCGKVYKSSSHLRNHLYRHARKMQYKCKVCQRSFKYRGIFESHKLIHSNDKAFMCENCGKGFVQKYSFEKHTCFVGV